MVVLLYSLPVGLVMMLAYCSSPNPRLWVWFYMFKGLGLLLVYNSNSDTAR